MNIKNVWNHPLDDVGLGSEINGSTNMWKNPHTLTVTFLFVGPPSERWRINFSQGALYNDIVIFLQKSELKQWFFDLGILKPQFLQENQ